MIDIITSPLASELLGKYNQNLPYHGPHHGLTVSLYISEFVDRNSKEVVSCLGHDAGLEKEKNRKSDSRISDEQVAAGITKATLLRHTNFLLSHGIGYEEIDKIFLQINNSAFSERGKLEKYEDKLLADCDILGSTGDTYEKVLQNSARLYLEESVETTNEGGKIQLKPNREGIINFFRNNVLGFFKYLTAITGYEDNPFLTTCIADKYTNFPKNRDRLINDLENNQELLINTVREEFRRFYGAYPVII